MTSEMPVVKKPLIRFLICSLGASASNWFCTTRGTPPEKKSFTWSEFTPPSCSPWRTTPDAPNSPGLSLPSGLRMLLLMPKNALR